MAILVAIVNERSRSDSHTRVMSDGQGRGAGARTCVSSLGVSALNAADAGAGADADVTPGGGAEDVEGEGEGDAIISTVCVITNMIYSMAERHDSQGKVACEKAKNKVIQIRQQNDRCEKRCRFIRHNYKQFARISKQNTLNLC